jgi:small conductance mechanosensitive channel
MNLGLTGSDLHLADHWILGLVPTLVGALAVFVGFLVAAALAARTVTRLGRLRALDEDLTSVLARAARLTLVTFGVVTAVGTLGVDVKALVAGLGLTGFALGFALKDIISNTLAGILILLYKPFHRGDRVEVLGSEGMVESIDMRYTRLLAKDGSRVLVPNANLFTNSIRVSKQPPPAPTL